MNYDNRDYHATLEAALQAADYNGFAARKADAKAGGKLRGIGLYPVDLASKQNRARPIPLRYSAAAAGSAIAISTNVSENVGARPRSA
jgi:hypothetical protein